MSTKNIASKKLEIGPGAKPKEGYVHFDIRPLAGVDVVGDAKKLPFKDGEFECVFSRFFLEHLLRNDAKLALKEMLRVLKKGGELELIVPDLAYFCKLFVEESGQKKEWALNKIYGFEKYSEDHHNFGYDFSTLKSVLEEVGFVGVKQVKEKVVGAKESLGVAKEKEEQYLHVIAKKK